jgi:RNA polymerase sigma-70 factor (ECF subfamily)
MDGPARAAEPGRSNEVLTELIGKIARRDEGALAELYDRTSRVVYGLALQMVAEQSAADAFAPEQGTVLNWLVVLARGRALDWLRCSGASVAFQNDRAAENNEKSEAFWGSRGDSGDGGSDSTRAQLVRQFVFQLPNDERKVIGLALFRGLTHTDIARRTGLPHGAVKLRIRNGMIQLRERLSLLNGREGRDMAARVAQEHENRFRA